METAKSLKKLVLITEGKKINTKATDQLFNKNKNF